MCADKKENTTNARETEKPRKWRTIRVVPITKLSIDMKFI